MTRVDLAIYRLVASSIFLIHPVARADDGLAAVKDYYAKFNELSFKAITRTYDLSAKKKVLYEKSQTDVVLCKSAIRVTDTRSSIGSARNSTMGTPETTEYFAKLGESYATAYSIDPANKTPLRVKARSFDFVSAKKLQSSIGDWGYPFAGTCGYIDFLAMMENRNKCMYGDASISYNDGLTKFTIDVDPRKGGVPTKFSARKVPSKIALAENSSANVSQEYDDVQVSIATKEFMQVSSVYIPKSYTIEVTTRHNTIGENRFLIEVDISDFHFCETACNQNLLPSVVIPNGTTVFVQDQLQIDHEWQDGQIVKSIDKSVVLRADSAKFKQTVSWRIIAIFSTPAVLLLVILGWRFRAKRRSPQ
jgi:hypothetical protein